MARMSQQQFENFTASSLYCEKCKAAMPVRERLLLILPEKEIFDYLCTGCGSSVGQREVTAGEKMMAQATAPAFVLGAVAGFVSILLGRVASILDRIRRLNEIPDDDAARGSLKLDIPRLRRRAKLLNGATHLALASGICTALLLVVGFMSAFFHVKHEYGAGLLFVVAVALLGGSLFRFAQEVRIGLSEADHYH